MFEQIGGGLFVFSPDDGGCNCYLLSGAGKTLIDTGLAGSMPALKSSLLALGIGTEEIGLILHTHGHADHFSADRLFPDAEIRMHAADAEAVGRKDSEFTCSRYFPGSRFPKITSPLRVGEVISLGQFSLRVLRTPGHTAGSVCFYDAKKGLLFSGDTLFSGSVGRYDLPSSSGKELIGSLRALQKLDFGLLLPGHGPVLRGEQKENIRSLLPLVG